MKFFDLFAGIGGFRLGMEVAGHECVGFCEIDKFARASYKAIHDTEGEVELHDITEVSDDTIRGIGHVDVICGGFPCQAFSIAGARRGFKDTRGTLFFEITRFASILRPKLLLLENVKGLLNHDRGDTFKTILGALDELGYDVEWEVLNSKNFGVPQNRERVFVIGHLRGQRTREVFPFRSNSAKVDMQNEQSTNTLTARYAAAQSNGSYIIESEQKAIRKLTPRECWRLQGFPDWAFDKAREVNSDSQLYKQAGNSVTVNVIAAIAKRIKVEDN